MLQWIVEILHKRQNKLAMYKEINANNHILIPITLIREIIPKFLRVIKILMDHRIINFRKQKRELPWKRCLIKSWKRQINTQRKIDQYIETNNQFMRKIKTTLHNESATIKKLGDSNGIDVTCYIRQDIMYISKQYRGLPNEHVKATITRSEVQLPMIHVKRLVACEIDQINNIYIC